MATAQHILDRKGPQVWTVGKEASVLQGALIMNEHKIGALVVLDQGKVVGMFTERDVLLRVVAQHRDPADTQVADVMTTEVVCCTPATSIEEAQTAMMNRRIRHLPVVNDGRHLVGLISIGDLNAYQAAAREETIYLLNEYIYGRS